MFVPTIHIGSMWAQSGQLVILAPCRINMFWLRSGKNTSTTHDWFDAKSSEMRPVIEAERTILMEYKRSPSERNRQIIRAVRSKVQQTASRCANEYWTQLSQDTQTAAITGNIRGMYDGIKKALGPTQSKTAPSSSLVGR